MPDVFAANYKEFSNPPATLSTQVELGSKASVLHDALVLLYNRKVLLGAGLPQTQNMQIEYVFDNFENDSVQFPHDTSSLYLHNIDEHVVHCADSVIRKNASDLSWIYLEYTDDVGHAKGTGAAFDSAVGVLDIQIRKVEDAIHYRENNLMNAGCY